MRLNRNEKLSNYQEENYNQGSLKEINRFGHKLTSTKSLPLLSVAF